MHVDILGFLFFISGIFHGNHSSYRKDDGEFWWCGAPCARGTRPAAADTGHGSIQILHSQPANIGSPWNVVGRCCARAWFGRGFCAVREPMGCGMESFLLDCTNFFLDSTPSITVVFAGPVTATPSLLVDRWPVFSWNA